jgi:hypothetical protein
MASGAYGDATGRAGLLTMAPAWERLFSRIAIANGQRASRSDPGDCSSARATARHEDASVESHGKEKRGLRQRHTSRLAPVCAHSFRAEREVHLRVRVSDRSAKCQRVVLCFSAVHPSARN